MNMINKGIPYFPTPANFFDEEVMELLEAKFGVLASYMVMRLLCKIYKEGYYISWGKEQNLIFVRKVGGGIKEVKHSPETNSGTCLFLVLFIMGSVM